MLNLEFAQLSDVGRVREQNEDFLGHLAPEDPEQARSQGWLFALADGVGGQEFGEIASRTAVESVLAGFRGARAGEPLTALLPRLIETANAQVCDAGLAVRPGCGGIATTLVLCGLRFDRAVMSHVGDSRCYLIRRGHAVPLTSDHTIANEHVGMGVLTRREASAAQTRHLLSRSLGAELFVNVDTSEHLVLPGDVLLLCSDGLYGPVAASEMAQVVSHCDSLPQAARDLVAIANERDGEDNVSVQLIRIRSVERVGMYRGRPYRIR